MELGNKSKKLKKSFSAKEGRRFMEERGFEYVGKARDGEDFKIPKWMDCAWRRVPCDKWSCKICGKMKQDRMAHIAKGEDPDSMESVLDDVRSNFKQAMMMIKKDAEKRGIDITNISKEDLEEPPEPEEFPLYRKLKKWHQSASNFVNRAENQNSAWLLTEAGADLMWYKNTLLAKTYRQLCTRLDLGRGSEYGEIDFAYTKYVLGECLRTLKKSLRELSDSAQNKELKVLLSGLVKLEKEVRNI